MLVTPNSACRHRTVAFWSKSSLSSWPGWPSHSLCPNPGCFPPCWMLSGYGVWLCPWHPARMAGQGDPQGRKCPKGWGQAPSGYPWNKRAGIAPGASHSHRSQRADLFCFSPLPLLHGGVDGSCLRTDAGESRLCLPASPAERGRGCSWIEVLICHLQVLCIPRQEISGAKHRLFVTYRRALCRARLLKAIWCL